MYKHKISHIIYIYFTQISLNYVPILSLEEETRKLFGPRIKLKVPFRSLYCENFKQKKWRNFITNILPLTFFYTFSIMYLHLFISLSIHQCSLYFMHFKIILRYQHISPWTLSMYIINWISIFVYNSFSFEAKFTYSEVHESQRAT